MILAVFRQYDPEYVMNPRWCDEIYESKFEKEKSLSEIVAASTVLSLIIALLGLFAIHSYTASRRTKEIGIRKVFGSKSWSIIYLLSSDVIKLIMVAGIISVPISYLIGRTWLENYTNRTDIGWLLLFLPVIVQGVFAALATFLVSLRISNKNPVEALRYE
jgi:putative ABC transport system permease protein